MTQEQFSLQNLQGRLYQIKGHEPILLNDPQKIFVVQSGTVAIFAVTVNEDAIEGSRRYLFSCESGEVIFGTAAKTDLLNSTSFLFAQNRQLLAVSIGSAQLLEIDRLYFQELVTTADARVEILIANWLQKLDTILLQVAKPAIEIVASEPTRFSLVNAQTFQLEKERWFWVRVNQGCLRWMGIAELTLTAANAFVPFNDTMWLKADGAVQLTTQTTSTLKNKDTLLTGISQLNRYLLNYVQYLEQEECTEELARLYSRENLNRQVTASAISELASPLTPKNANFFLEGAPLLMAAGAVGRAMGITIRPPAASEDPKRVKEPLEAIVRASRLRMRQVLLRDNWWKYDCSPLVAYTQEDAQPVALLPTASTGYEIFNPVAQTRIPLNADNALSITPIAYMFYRSLPDKILNIIDVLRFALFNRGKDLLAIVFAGIAATLLGMLVPHANAILIDHAIPDSDRGLLLQVGLGLLVAAFGTALFRLGQGFSLLRVETTSDISTQAAVWDRLLNLPVSFFRQYTTGDLQSRVTSVNSIRRQLGGSTLIGLISGLFALLNLGLLFYYSNQLALIAVGVAIVTTIATAVSGVILVRKVRPLLEIEGDIFGQTVQLINGISKLRIAGAEERAFAFWSKNYSQQIKLDLSTQIFEDIVVIFNTVMPTLTSAILFWFAIKLLSQAQTAGEVGFSVGTFVAFNAAFATFIKGITDVSNTLTDTLQVVPQWQRAQPILSSIPEVESNKSDPGRLIGRITVEHVTFRYRSDRPLILDDVSIHAEPGEFIALVGGSGSGKSTIFRLLLGFEMPEDGSIYYDGQDLSGLDISAVRRQLGVVLQTGKMMSGSIFDNLAGGARVTLDEAWEAARMSGLADDITAMPMGMHTVISEGGGNLSGGQRQRLLIAKALILKPRILLFDEATSALDNRTQAIVSENLDKQKVTRIVIAHRLSTIRNAHRIYVLQAGRIVQQGSFDELASVEGLFADLMRRQVT